MSSSKISRFFQRTWFVWVVMYFFLLTLLMTWPLVLKMRGEMVGQIGDNIYFVWMISWFKKALFDLHTNPFNVWFLNYPEGWNMAYTEITPVMILMALPFSFLGGAMFAYNMAMMITFVLSGLAMFIWVRHLTGSIGAALVSGTIYAFIPYHFAHFLIGHLNLSGIMWLPLYFMGFCDVLEMVSANPPGQKIWKPAILAGISLGLTGLTSQYYLYMAILVSAFMLLWYAIVEWLRWRKNSSRSDVDDVNLPTKGILLKRQLWINLGWLTLASIPLVLAAVAPYVALNRQGGLPDRNLGVVRMYSASPTDFILPSTQHFLWGAWVGSHFNRQMWVEGTLYVGVVSLILAVLAWVKYHHVAHNKILWMLLGGTIFAVVMAMGTDLHWNGEALQFQVPGFLSDIIHRKEVPILLPGYFFFQYFPFFAKLRALMRFGIFALVFICAMAGMGAGWLLEKVGRRWQVLLTVGLLCLVFLDFYPGPYTEFAKATSRPVDAWLAAQPGSGAVIQFPFSENDDQEQTYYTLQHNKPYVGGFFNAFPPPQYRTISPMMDKFPDQTSIALLPKLGVEYVLVNSNVYPDMGKIRARAEEFGLHFVGIYGGQWVFTLH